MNADGAMTAAWFDDPASWIDVPWAFRMHAHYCRRAIDRSTGMIRGGSFFWRLASRVQRFTGGSRSAVFRLGGRTVHVDLDDPRMLTVLEEVRGNAPEFVLLSRCLRPGDTLIDIGANHGALSLIAASILGPAGTIIAFEPQPRPASLLRKSLSITAQCAWHVHELAAVDSTSDADLFVPAENSGAASIFADYASGKVRATLRVAVRRVDDVLEEEQLSGAVFMKLDVEGSELLALRGCDRLLRSHMPPILLEVNPTSAAAAGAASGELLTFLFGCGDRSAIEVEQSSIEVAILSLDTTRQRNVLVVPPGFTGLSPNAGR